MTAAPKRPQEGARVEILPHRIVGEIVRVREAMRHGFWWLDILPETAISDTEVVANVYSEHVLYAPKNGPRRPVSPVGEEPKKGSAA